MITILGPGIVVIGNSGSGKSTLAKSLDARLGGDLVDLDRVHWQDKVGLERDETGCASHLASPSPNSSTSDARSMMYNTSLKACQT